MRPAGDRRLSSSRPAEPRHPFRPVRCAIGRALSLARRDWRSARPSTTKEPSCTLLTPASRRRGVLTLAGVTAGAILAIAAPLAASAHVHVDPDEASAGATSTLTFAFSHGCDESPTTALVIDIPDGVGNATPVVQGGWTIARELGTDGVPTQVTFTSRHAGRVGPQGDREPRRAVRRGHRRTRRWRSR